MEFTPEQREKLERKYGASTSTDKANYYYGPTIGLAPIRTRPTVTGVTEASLANSPFFGALFGGLGEDKFEPVTGFNPEEYIGPELEQYRNMLKTAKSPQRFVQMKEFYARRQEREALMADASFMQHAIGGIPAQIFDPINLAINLGTGYGAATASRLFLNKVISSASVIKNNATILGRAAGAITRNPVKFSAAQGAAFAGADAFVSSYAQDTLAKQIDPLGIDDTHKLENAVYSAMYGMFFGAIGGTYQGYKAKKDFADIANFVMKNDTPDPVVPDITAPVESKAGQTILASGEAAPAQKGMESPQVSPEGNQGKLQETPKPMESTYPPMILASGEEIPKLSPSEARAKAMEAGKLEQAKEAAGAGERLAWYNDLKQTFDMVAPNQLVRFFNKAILKLSPANRLIGSNFGSAKLAAASLARVAYEFVGTSMEKIVPQSVQIKIIAAQGRLNGVRMEHQKLFAQYNKTAEKVLSIDEFNKMVGDHMLVVGKKGHVHAIPEIEQSAKIFYDLYKPYGDKLRALGIIEGDDAIESLNYINRMYDKPGMISDPESFINTESSWISHVNERLKRLMPMYREKKKLANSTLADARRYRRMEDSLIKESERFDVAKIKEKIKQATEKRDAKIAKAKEIREKRIKEAQESLAGSVDELKANLKQEFKNYKKEVKEAGKFYDNEIKIYKRELDVKRQELKEVKRKIANGGFDEEIKLERIRQLEATLIENTGGIYDAKQLKQQAVALIEEEWDQLDVGIGREAYFDENFSALRKDIEALVPFINDLKAEKKEFLKKTFGDLELETRAVNDSIEQVGKLDKQSAAQKLRNRIAEIKYKHAESKANRLYKESFQDITRDFANYERKKQRYSPEGYKFEQQFKDQAKGVEQLRELYGDDWVKQNLKLIKKELRESLLPKKTIEQLLEKPFEIKAGEVAGLLEEMHPKLLDEAEKLIPNDFRSSTTGNPYPIFDEAVNPDYARQRAESVYNNVLGRNNDVVINPTFNAIMNGKPNSLKARTNKIPDNWPGADKMFVRDIEVLANQMVNSVAPVLAMADLAKTLNGIDVAKVAWRKLLVEEKVAQGMNKDIAYSRITMENLPEITYRDVRKVFLAMMAEERNDMLKGAVGEERLKIENAAQMAANDFDEVFKEVMGLNAGGYNTNSKYASDLVDLANGMASTVVNSNIFMSFMQDFLVPATQHGFGKVVRSWMSMLNSPEIKNLSKQEAQKLGYAIKSAQSDWVAHKWYGNPNSPKASTFAYNLQKIRRKLSFFTGSSAVQDAVLNTSWALNTTEVLDACVKAVNGTLDTKGQRWLGKLGIDNNQAKLIADLFEKYGFEKDGGKGIDSTNVGTMTPNDTLAMETLNMAVLTEVETFHGNVGLTGSTGFGGDNPIAKLFLFLKSYFFKVTTDVLVPAAQRWDSQALEGYLMMLGGGMLSSELRAMARGEDRSDMSLSARIYEGLETGGNLGVASIFASQSIAGMAGLTDSRFGTGGFNAPVIGLAGQVANNIAKWRKTMTDEDSEVDPKLIRQTLSFIPAARFMPIAIGLRVALNEGDE
jgi:hypothetical protein